MKQNPIITAILIASISTIILDLTYIGGSFIAEHIGRPQRGGVGWGIGVQIVIAAFFVVSLVQNCALRLSDISKTNITIVAAGIYTVITIALLGNQFSGNNWAHPYSYSYFMACSYIILFIPAMKQLTSQSTRTNLRGT